MVAMTGMMIDAILGIHNELRNKIALGKVKNYDSAAHMATMEWDDGLASLATLNVYRCEKKSDNCKSGNYKSKIISIEVFGNKQLY